MRLLSLFVMPVVTGTLQLGPLRLTAPRSWTFHQFGKTILARASRRGTLQITLAYADDAPIGVGHAMCQEIMRQFMEEPPSRVVYAEEDQNSEVLYGYAIIHDAKLFRRYSYRCKHGRLLLGLFQCTAVDFDEACTEIEEANAIVATMELEK